MPNRTSRVPTQFLHPRSAAPSARTGERFFVILCVGCAIAFSLLVASLSSHGGTAGTANIVDTLRGLRAVGMMYFADNLVDGSFSSPGPGNHIELLEPYVDRPEQLRERQSLFCVTDKALWVGRDLRKMTGEVRRNLMKRRRSQGEFVLFGSTEPDVPPAGDGIPYVFGDNAVCMRVVDSPMISPARGGERR